jgi:hypothetical protein
MRMKAQDLGIHYDTKYLGLSSGAIVEAVVGITADFSDALDKAGIETPRGEIRRKLNKLVVEQNVTPVNVEQGVIQAQGPVEQPVVQGSKVSLQTTPVGPEVVQSGLVQEGQPVPVEHDVVQGDQGHVVQVPVELGVVQAHIGVAPDRKAILTFIRDQLLAGHELQPKQVAEHFNISPISLGKHLGIKPKGVRYGKDVKRVYAKSLLPEIEKLLKVDEKATSVPVEQPVVQPVEHKVTPSKGADLEPVDHPVTQDRRAILTFIRDQIQAGIYLQPYQVAAKFGMDPIKMSKLIVIKPAAKKIKGESVRVYKESHLPEIEALLKKVAPGKDVTPGPVEPKVTPSEDPLHPKPRSWFVPIYHKRTLQSDKDAFLYKERRLPLIRVIKTEIGYKYTITFNYMTGTQREAPRIFSEKEGLEHKIADFLYENQLLPADEQRKRVKKYMEEIK